MRSARSESWNPFSASQWIAWLGATCFAGISMTAGLILHANDTFVSKRETDKINELLIQRLDRIENKIDSIRREK